MLRSTFILLDGVGEKIERRLWRTGHLVWEDFVAARTVSGISPARKAGHDRMLEAAREALDLGDAAFFSRRLARREQWRLYDAFRDSVRFLDIETTGGPGGGDVTVVGLSDGIETRSLVRGIDLTIEALREALEPCRMLVTFFGTGFDLPVLARCFPEIDWDRPHLDLCFALRRLGLRGGLKWIEEAVGLQRDEEVRGLDGYDAVRLWRAYNGGAERALDLLVRYNGADVRNLAPLADFAVQGLHLQVGIPSLVAGQRLSPSTLPLGRKGG